MGLLALSFKGGLGMHFPKKKQEPRGSRLAAWGAATVLLNYEAIYDYRQCMITGCCQACGLDCLYENTGPARVANPLFKYENSICHIVNALANANVANGKETPCRRWSTGFQGPM